MYKNFGQSIVNLFSKRRNFWFKITLIFLASLVFSLIVFHPSEVSAAMINIRDQNGDVTTWGWWLINIFAPFFVIFELLKVVIGLVLLPTLLFGSDISLSFLFGGLENIFIMIPGLLVHFIFGTVNS